MKYRFIPIVIIFITFFFIPFFWLKPGEMDLGGDSSRLYFYDPIRYLFGQSLFSVSRSAFGGESLSFFGIPFFLFLFVVKSVLRSPTTLISAFHGFSLSLAFATSYLIVKELLKRDVTDGKNKIIIEASSILAGLFYTLSPISILGWGYAILTYNQVFLNPLMLFLLLRFFLTNNMLYIIAMVILSFIFAPNFSYIGAPSFFAFYPIAIIYLLIYIKFIRHLPISINKLAIGVLLFAFVHAFHLIPQIANILTPGSSTYQTVFANEGKAGTIGYFSAIASGVKVSLSLLSQPQLINRSPFSWIFIVPIFLLAIAFIWNKKKTYLLTGIFFLIIIYFYTANITGLGFKLYVLAFHFPGFSMFRNFYGQWQWTYLFFYMLFFGQALFIVLMHIKKVQRLMLVGFLALLLVATSWHFITGKLTDTTFWQSKNIKSHVVMDPQYEKVLTYIRSLPVDGKVLSLPLDNHGYQVVKGKNDAAYGGPSTITYLTNKNEFKGYDELGEFGQTFLSAAKDKNYEVLRDIFAMFNIKYIFYNSDPYIYDENFPAFPYQYVSQFLPPTQEGYKEFIKNLGVKEIKTIAGKYHIYEVDNASYLPHVYVAKKAVYWNDYLINLHTPLSFYPQEKRLVINNDNKIFSLYTDIFDDLFLKAQNKSQIFDFFKTRKPSKFASPYVSQKLSSLIYPLVVLRERIMLTLNAKLDDKYIDRSIFYAEKRINELEKWIGDVPVLGNVESIKNLEKMWKDPTILEFTKYIQYNSWEITLVRYQKAMKRLIDELEKPSQSNYSNITNKVELKNVLIKHKDKLRKIIREDSSISIEEKKYLLNLARDMFNDIVNKLNLSLPDDWIIPYKVGNPLRYGIYQVYVNKDDIKNLDITLSIDGKSISPKAMDEGEWIRFDDIAVKNKHSLSVAIKLNKIPNLVGETKWKTAEQTKGEIAVQSKVQEAKQKEARKDVTTLTITYSYLGNTSGLIRDISNWRGNSIYSISLDYLTYDKNFLLTLYERGGTKKNRYVNDTHSEILHSKEWRKFRAVILSRNDAQSAFLQISKDQDDIQDENNTEGIKKIDIRNLSILRITDPQIADPRIVFKKIVKAEETSIPQIIFTKINPTKYKVTVHGAKGPYALILSEKFNTSWKIFFPNKTNEAKTLKGLISKTLGKIMKDILTANNIVISSDQSKEELTSYFNNKIIEGMHKNVFLDQNTFETFGYDPISEKTHLPVNGYANAWYISPEDLQNKEDYTLIIEMTTQKLFYGSLLVSLGGLSLLSFILFRSFIRLRRKPRL